MTGSLPITGAPLWIEIVEEYTRRELTHEKDKLIAISGIAAQLQLACEDTYVAGMWRTSLIHLFTWSIPSKRYLPPSIHSSYPPAGRGHLSMNRPVRLMMLEEVDAELVEHSATQKRAEAPLTR